VSRLGNAVVNGQDRGAAGAATQHVADRIGHAYEHVGNGGGIGERERRLRPLRRKLMGLDDDRESARTRHGRLGERPQRVGVDHVRSNTLEGRTYAPQIRRSAPASPQRTRALAPAPKTECEGPLALEYELQAVGRGGSQGTRAGEPTAGRPPVCGQLLGRAKNGDARAERLGLVEQRENAQHAGGP
jgi:hypothetical protein